MFVHDIHAEETIGPIPLSMHQWFEIMDLYIAHEKLYFGGKMKILSAQEAYEHLPIYIIFIRHSPTLLFSADWHLQRGAMSRKLLYYFLPSSRVMCSSAILHQHINNGAIGK